MKRILIVAVNYNSYSELIDYLDSIEVSMSMVIDQCSMDVYVADNSSQKEVIDTAKYHNFNLHVVPLDNLGYFGGAFHVINNLIDPKRYTYVIISNVDILFEKEMLYNLLNIELPDSVAWISPYRYSIKYNMPLFVEHKFRLPKWKMILFLLIYRFSILYKILYIYTLHRYRKAMLPSSNIAIYSGCGSCFIFTNLFFQKISYLEYPVFLYGEEIFIAELLRMNSLKALYVPTVKIKNIGEVSTSKINRKRFRYYNYLAIKYLLERFY